MKSSRLSYQRQPPFGRLSPCQTYWVELSNIHPLVRIAHHLSRMSDIAERIIFDYELVLFLAGRGRVILPSQTIDFEAGHLFLFRPFVPHAIEVDSSEPCEHLAIHFDLVPDIPPAIDRLDERSPYDVRLSHGQVWPTHLALSRAYKIESLMRRAIEAHDSTQPLARLSAMTYLTQLLIEMFQIQARCGTESQQTSVCRVKLERAIRLVEEHLASDLTVEDLAEAAGLSASYLTRLFKQWVGTTPMNYLRQARVQRARTLLADVDLSIQQVGAAVGFDDPYHFSKVFRRVDGLSPSAFRQILLAGRNT